MRNLLITADVAWQVASDKDAAVNSASVAGAVRLLARQSDEKALKFLQKMPCSVAARALMLLKVGYFY